MVLPSKRAILLWNVSISIQLAVSMCIVVVQFGIPDLGAIASQVNRSLDILQEQDGYPLAMHLMIKNFCTVENWSCCSYHMLCKNLINVVIFIILHRPSRKESFKQSTKGTRKMGARTSSACGVKTLYSCGAATDNNRCSCTASYEASSINMKDSCLECNFIASMFIFAILSSARYVRKSFTNSCSLLNPSNIIVMR